MNRQFHTQPRQYMLIEPGALTPSDKPATQRKLAESIDPVLTEEKNKVIEKTNREQEEPVLNGGAMD